MALETETAYYNSMRHQWISNGYENKWVVVNESQLLGFYDDIETGYEAGAVKFGPGNFLLKQVTDEDSTETIQRVFWGANDQKKAAIPR